MTARAEGGAGAADGPVLDRWWAWFLRTGTLPAELQLVQGRLVRAVYRGELPSGPVFVKVMAFPRRKDRVRYLLRPLPGEHEANLLAATAAAGIRCPEVVDVRSARRRLLPFRSFLVLRALPVAAAPEVDAAVRLRDEAALARRLLAVGLVHHDLHGGNFVRLDGGDLAVLDLQSARRHGGPRLGRGPRIAAAARLLREHGQPWAGPAVVAGGLLTGPDELAAALRLAERERLHYLRSRVLRCLHETTGFTRTVRWNGVEHRVRADLPEGRWRSGGRELRRCWLGQRALQVLEGRPLVFPAFFQKWWWLGGAASLYVPRACEDRIDTELASAEKGFGRYRAQPDARGAEGHGDQPE